MCHFLGAARVSTIAGKFDLVAGVVAIRAAILLAISSHAITGRVCALLGISHPSSFGMEKITPIFVSFAPWSYVIKDTDHQDLLCL
jgi:hypothetical protein